MSNLTDDTARIFIPATEGDADMSTRSFLIGQASWFVILACVSWGCGPNTPPVAETPPPPVTVSQPIVREVIDEDDYEGRIAAMDNVEIRARVKGGVAAHCGNAAEAAPTARSTSLLSAKATRWICSPVAGLKTAPQRPLVPSTHRPPM